MGKRKKRRKQATPCPEDKEKIGVVGSKVLGSGEDVRTKAGMCPERSLDGLSYIPQNSQKDNREKEAKKVGVAAGRPHFPKLGYC